MSPRAGTPTVLLRIARPAPLLLALLLAAALAGPVWTARAQDPAGLKEKRAQINQLTRERSQAEQQLAHFEAAKSELSSEIEKLAELVRQSLQRKQALQAQFAAQQALAAQQAREAARLEKEIHTGERRIGLRLRRLYRVSKQSDSGLLFQMARFQTFAKDSRYLALLQESDRAAIAHFEAMNRELDERRQQVTQSMERLEALRTELDDETRQLADRESYLRSAMADVQKNRTLYAKYLADVQQMMGRMQAAVARLEAEAKAAAPLPRPKSPAVLRGTLPPPAEGRIIASFGAQDPRYDLKKRQRGIVVRVAPRSPVKAVAPGRALHAGPFRGYQSLVVLDHGEGLFTVYGHLQDLKIKRGDWVPQGAVLGEATYQPVDEAYDVYFEIRYNGKPDDPLAWLQPGRLPMATGGAAGG